jgi:hypothetical protein
MTSFDRLLTQFGNLLFDWTLLLPRDLTLLLLAVLLIALLLGLRRLLSDQEALRLLTADVRRLQDLRAEARAAGDRAALARHWNIRRLLAARRARLEMLPALAGLLPALLVLHWGARRLEHLPFNIGDPVEIEATFPASAVGRPAYLVPQESLTAKPAWIRTIEPAAGAEARGVADWQVTATAPGEFAITLRHPGGSAQVPLEMGNRRYAPSIIRHGGDVTTAVKLPRYRPLGMVPPIPRLGLPAWMVGLLLLTVPGYLAARRLLRIP